MKDLPILFSGAMVRAILRGRKTMTRRLVMTQPEKAPHGTAWYWRGEILDDERLLRMAIEDASRFKIGRRMWVREAWHPDISDPVLYAADYESKERAGVQRWFPGIHMRREDSRITLVVTAHRVERLHEITEADARAEGVAPAGCGDEHCDCAEWSKERHRTGFARLWDTINGKRAPWASNPLVEVVSFERVQP